MRPWLDSGYTTAQTHYAHGCVPLLTRLRSTSATSAAVKTGSRKVRWASQAYKRGARSGASPHTHAHAYAVESCHTVTHEDGGGISGALYNALDGVYAGEQQPDGWALPAVSTTRLSAHQFHRSSGHAPPASFPVPWPPALFRITAELVQWWNVEIGEHRGGRRGGACDAMMDLRRQRRQSSNVEQVPRPGCGQWSGCRGGGGSERSERRAEASSDSVVVSGRHTRRVGHRNRQAPRLSLHAHQ